MGRRVVLVVLDSFGVGESPDAAQFGDVNVNTLRSCAGSPFLKVPHMASMGLFQIDGVREALQAAGVWPAEAMTELRPDAVYGRLQERSKGKDTVTGHWEIAGVVSEKPMPTFPEGFPEAFLREFEAATGRGTLCNKPYSGTQVIADYGEEHLATGKLIVYTSADSVFQIAAHEDIVPCEQLYEYCRIARRMLTGELGVGRVIARPFVGVPGAFERTPRRHDFALEPTGETMLDALKAAGKEVLGVGKIHDIFEARGLTDFVFTEGNADGVDKTLAYLKRDFDGLLFVNLVDFDMLYGHRRDIDGYARALTYFDERLPEIEALLKPEDVLILTADHGCDPAYLKTTDHTREYIPVLMTGGADLHAAEAGESKPRNIGTGSSFADISATVLELLGGVPGLTGTSFLRN